MSKFIDNIGARFMGRTTKVMPQLSAKCEKLPGFPHSNLGADIDLGQYYLGVEYREIVTCRPEELRVLRERFIRQLTQDIYGDFWESLIALERAVYERNFTKSQEILKDIFGEIY